MNGVTSLQPSTNIPLNMLILMLFIHCFAKIDEDFQAGLEPGHVKQDYDSVEEVKGHDTATETEKSTEDENLMREAILDVAYYLRRFKFSGYDPRYLAKGEIPKQNLFVEFPSPPLRNIHWEVKKNCEPSFLECVKYLQEQLSQTVLPRHLDSLTITKQNGWSFITDRDLIKSTDDECLKLLKTDENTFTVFSGPLQKFQWLTSASYYMCQYTLKENSHLSNFAEDCDNYASCIQWDAHEGNKDFRADNRNPFACALYSFCPDPCCPLKYLSKGDSCSKNSPCFGDFTKNATCAFSRAENTDFESLILNQWNVSCNCDEPGMRWESRSGICVDIDECLEKESPCKYPSETCRNALGSYKCVCSGLGWQRDPETKSCEKDPILYPVFYPPHILQNDTNYISNKFTNTMVDIVKKFKSVMAVPLANNFADPNKTEDF